MTEDEQIVTDEDAQTTPAPTVTSFTSLAKLEVQQERSETHTRNRHDSKASPRTVTAFYS